jgi:hypothetical protein
MTTGGITETGIQSNLISQQMNELNQQSQVTPDKGKETSTETTDTINLTSGIWEREMTGIDAIEEEDAKILSQLVASNLGKQPFSISMAAGTEILRTFV